MGKHKGRSAARAFLKETIKTLLNPTAAAAWWETYNGYAREDVRRTEAKRRRRLLHHARIQFTGLPLLKDSPDPQETLRRRLYLTRIIDQQSTWLRRYGFSESPDDENDDDENE